MMKLIAALTLALTFSQAALAFGPGSDNCKNGYWDGRCQDDPANEFWKDWNCKQFGVCEPARPPRNTTVNCVARDSAGLTYRATGRYDQPKSTQKAALASCYEESARPNSCSALGCNKTRW